MEEEEDDTQEDKSSPDQFDPLDQAFDPLGMLSLLSVDFILCAVSRLVCCVSMSFRESVWAFIAHVQCLIPFADMSSHNGCVFSAAVVAVLSTKHPHDLSASHTCYLCRVPHIPVSNP